MNWLRSILSGQPHVIIGGRERPYMLRWWIVPRNPLFGVYLHKFMRDDDDRALHDHPWWFVSLVLKGGYSEITESGTTERHHGSLAFRRAEHRHRVVLSHGRPCWTLVVRGPVKREWGFWCPKGFIHWRIFTAADDRYSIGPGCRRVKAA